MKKVLYILFSLTIFISLLFSIFLLKVFDGPMHYRYHYEYIGLNGDIGTSPACYTIEDGRDFCRNAKKAYPVAKYEKVKERK